MATPSFESAGTNQPYNIGIVRVPGVASGLVRNDIAPVEKLFADLLSDKDIVGGQVEKGFVGLLGQPLKLKDATGASGGTYVKAAAADTDIAGLLLLSVDAYDGARLINVVKGGTVNTRVGALKSMDKAALNTLATKLNGRYDDLHKTLKF